MFLLQSKVSVRIMKMMVHLLKNGIIPMKEMEFELFSLTWLDYCPGVERRNQSFATIIIGY